MTNREFFKRRVIELIHGIHYEEVVTKNINHGGCCNYKFGGYISGDSYKCKNCNHLGYYKTNITIGRVMKAIHKIEERVRGQYNLLETGYIFKHGNVITNWELTKEDGAECTDDDQTDETINKLLELIK